MIASKQIEVSCAVIFRQIDDKKEYFATARGYGDYKGFWEFPGGKLEEGESAENCIIREIQEELATKISIKENLGIVEYDYPNFHLKMHCFLCQIVDGNLELLEAQESRWLTKENFSSVNWLPADILVLEKLF